MLNTVVFVCLSLSEDTPNNKGKWDCVDVNEGYRGNLWDGTDCLSKRPFVCKYTLSGESTNPTVFFRLRTHARHTHTSKQINKQITKGRETD